jgi:hypothetical protein
MWRQRERKRERGAERAREGQRERGSKERKRPIWARSLHPHPITADSAHQTAHWLTGERHLAHHGYCRPPLWMYTERVSAAYKCIASLADSDAENASVPHTKTEHH